MSVLSEMGRVHEETRLRDLEAAASAHGLTVAELEMARRLRMEPANYAAMRTVRSIDDWDAIRRARGAA